MEAEVDMGRRTEAGVAAQKSALRGLMRLRLRELTESARANESVVLVDRIRALPKWGEARCVLLFSPLGDEPDIRPLWEEAWTGRRLLALPRLDTRTGLYGAAAVDDPERDLVRGRFGILEPAEHTPWVELRALDFVVVPGLAFDAGGGRLGRGKGFYDRLLAQVKGTTCGVGFDVQWVPEVPRELHDVRLHVVLTPSHGSCGPRGTD